MQWNISPAFRSYWCGAAQKTALECYGFQFGPINTHGQYPLVGPVTFRSAYGWEDVSVRVEIETLEAMMMLLDVLGVVCISMGQESCDGDHHFFLTPVSVPATGRPLTLEELGA